MHNKIYFSDKAYLEEFCKQISHSSRETSR